MEKVIYDFKDLGLAAYLIVNGNEFKGVDIKYAKRFNEFKIYIQIEGEKEQLNKMKLFYDENKVQILKLKQVIDVIGVLTDSVERNLKKEE